MKRNFLTKIALLLLLMGILTACAQLQSAPSPKPPLRVAFTQWWGDYTLLVAQETGLFEKYGAQVEPVYYDVFSDTFPDLAAGQIDVAFLAVGDIININRSAPMKVVAINDDGGADSIIARPEINSIQDLKGKKVGVLVGTQYELMVTEMLRSVNMNISDVTVIEVNPEDASQALKNNQVQAIYTWEPHLSEAVLNGNKVIYPTEKMRLFPDTIVFRKSVVDERPEDVRAFLKAWFQAVEYRLQRQGETQVIAAKYLGTSAEDVQPDNNLRLYTIEDNKALFDIQKANSIYSITKTTSDYLISIGVVVEATDPLELFDPIYLP
jgi:NitT/TauT family transport system substrate-binding protein